MSTAKNASPVIEVAHLRKEFRFYRRPWDRFVEMASGGRIQRGEAFVALDDVSFEVSAGQALGIIGANGAGKSTLLKILCRTLHQSAGHVAVRGRVASLLELGTGFHPDFTGRQNVFFNARFLGLTDREIEQRLGAILEFSELGAFLDRPLRAYSSGMQVRLAFAVIANVDPQVLVIDEALQVGDAYFQQKCVQRIRRFREQGVTLLFVSHDPTAVKTLCSDALLLDHGRIVARGKPEDVLASYNSLIARAAGSREILTAERRVAADGSAAQQHRAGSFAAIVESVQLRDAAGAECRSFLPGERATITVRALCTEPIANPTVGMLLRDRLGNDVYGTNTYHQEITTGEYTLGEAFEVVFALELHLGPGEYSLTVAVHTLDVHVHDCFDWIDKLLVFRVLAPVAKKFIGTAALAPQVSHRRLPPEPGPHGLARALVGAFGAQFPRALEVAVAGKPWVLAGWYPAEPGDGGAFRWTGATCSVLLDLRGERLCLEVGSDRPGTAPVSIAAAFLERPLGAATLPRDAAWCTCVLPIPQELRTAHALVRLLVEGWRPVASGAGGDDRLLGVRVRRIWVE